MMAGMLKKYKMSLPFFYEPTLTNAEASFTLSEESSKHAIQVLRMRNGEQLQITNGCGLLSTATIISDHKKHTIVTINQSSFINKSSKEICIAISPVKNNARFEWFLEKVTEIGITEIIPLFCERTERTNFRHDRMNNILVSAMLQSQQTWLPVLHELTDYEKMIASNEWSQKLIAHCEEDQKVSMNQLTMKNNVQILIGPEGDFTKAEIQLAKQNNYEAVSLGETRLRTETAGLVAAILLKNGL
jgi:16S rRNA (uracil1498-N3)-methyltransferase